jgi:DNA-binding XRE family transcriptional regulator
MTRLSPTGVVVPDRELGTNVRRLVGMHAMTLEEFAQWLGMSRQGIHNIASGKSQPSLVTARKIAAAFGVSTDALAADPQQLLMEAANAFHSAPVEKNRPT